MYKKNFDEWNILKKSTDENDKIPFFHSREIWFIRVGENIGFEQDGKGKEFLRPVFIYKKFSKNVFLGIPLTSQKKYGKFYFSFRFKDKVSTAILSQIRLFDSKRLSYFYGKVGKKNYRYIKKKLIELLQ